MLSANFLSGIGFGQDAPPSSIAALPPIHLRLKRFEIPFTVDALGKRPTEVQLFVSRDAGRQWIRFATQPPTGKSFLFDAKGDGEFWFATRTIDSAGNSHPEGNIEPQLHVLIDSTDPQVDLHAELTAQADVAIDIRCMDASADRGTLRLEYMTDVSGTWIEVPSLHDSLEQSQPDQLEGKLTFAPAGDWHQVSLRAIAKDKAGNQTIATHQLQRPRLATAPGQLASSPVNRNPASYAPSPVQAPPSPATLPTNPYAVKAMQIINPPPSNFVPVDGRATMGVQAAPGMMGTGPFMTAATPMADASAPPPLAGMGIESLPTPPADAAPSNQPALVGPGLNSANAPALTTAPVRRPSSPEQAMRPLTPEEVARPEPNVAPSAPQLQSSARPALGTAGSALDSRLADTFAPLDPSTTSSPIRYSGSRKFSLDYEVEAAGRAGVEEVELWGTADRGQTWKRWGADPDRQTPFDIETNNDGIYGFCIVVVAKNGLATPRPIAESSPDIYVVVDTIKPTVRITGANYGEADQTGSLLVRFTCDDANVATRPITLSFSNTQQGPWTTIAAGLENSGGYAWPADPQLPRQIYLRIDATDLAGNTGSYVLESAIDVQGLAPRARIRGFNPITGIPSTSGTAPQTASAPSTTLK
jgi:hypothetical protein